MNAALIAYCQSPAEYRYRRVMRNKRERRRVGEFYDLFQRLARRWLGAGGGGSDRRVGTRGMAQSGTWVRIGRKSGWKGPDSGPVGCLGLGSTFGSKARNQIPLV